MREIRNKIEHYQFDENYDDIKSYVGEAMYFLDTFLKEELEINLKKELDKIEPGIYEALSKAQLFYIRRMEESGVFLHPEDQEIDGYHFANCEECECEEESIVIPDPTTNDDSVHCFLCHARYFFSVEYCLSCHSANYSLGLLEGDDEFEFNFEDENNYGLCEFCIENFKDE